jgi:hypothetical protein
MKLAHCFKLALERADELRLCCVMVTLISFDMPHSSASSTISGVML